MTLIHQMIFSVGAVVLLCILVQSGYGDKKVFSKIVPIHHQPQNSSQVYQIHATTAAQCIHFCIQNPDCFVALYNYTASQCQGYRTTNSTEVGLAKEVKAWKLKYEGCSFFAPCLNGGVCMEGDMSSTCKCSYGSSGEYCETAESVNLLMHPETSCISGKEYDSTAVCCNAYDGTWISPGAYIWTAYDVGANTWITVTFAYLANLDHIQLWYRCAYVDQPSEALFEFSDSSIIPKQRRCDGGDDYWSCEEMVGFDEVKPTSSIMTEWIKITAVHMCDSDRSGRFGIRELICMGYFVVD